MDRLDPSVGREPPLYTMRRCRGEYSDGRFGPTHASECGDVTWCGVDTDESWWIETNRRGDGEVTCRKCAAFLTPNRSTTGVGKSGYAKGNTDG